MVVEVRQMAEVISNGDNLSQGQQASHSAAEMRLQGIDGRVAVVTGAASGIGRRVAEALTAMGARVGGIDLRRDDAGGLAASVATDVCDRGSVDEAFSEIERQLGPVELLVTSAGIFRPARLGDLSLDAWTATVSVNLTGTFLCVQRAAPTMLERGRGRIVTISSGAGLDGGMEECSDYAASKGGVIAFTKAVSKELAPHGVTANCVAPRNVSTAMIAGLEAEVAPQVPVGRIGTVDDVAAAVAFLCSAHASYITGEVLSVNGGWW
jgi:2-hydroxycyclohexanecarboxyl-CoA dehydrogenase